MEWRKVILGFLGCLFLAGISYGDMTATQPEGIMPGRMTPRASNGFESAAMRNLADLDWFAVQSLPPLTLGYDNSRGPGRPHVLADRRGSVQLCLYALLGLGLFKSVPCARRLPLGAIPAWYHESGPLEIGQCLAISSDCLCTVSVCFTQPEAEAEGLQPLYRLGVVEALWRQWQFIPTILASRAPPCLS